MSRRLLNCPCDGCSAQVPRHMAMCKPHWQRVPPKLRAEVRAAWREYTAAVRAMRGTGTPKSALDAAHRHRVAKNAAIAAANTQRTEAPELI